MNNKHLFKKVIAFMIVLISALTLTACKKDTLKIPYGSLDDTVFLSGDGYTITKKELYEEMRLSDLTVIQDLIFNIVMDSQIQKIKENREEYTDDFLAVVNTNIFSTDDIEELKDIDADILETYIARYVDLLYLEGVNINGTDIDIINFTDHSDVIFDHYILDVAKRIHAKELLDEDVLDKDSAYYINKHKDIATYFKSSVKKNYPLSSINIRFTNSYEANQTLRIFNLKTYRSKWYEIPDPRADVVTGYALEVLESLDLEGKNGALSESEHQQYYDKYVINPSREPAEDADVSLTIDEVLQVFFNIYNFVYPYKTPIDGSLYPTVQDLLDDETLVNDDEENQGLFTKLYDDYPSAQSSLRTYIYDTLGVKETDTRYTASPRPYGNYYFITFKLADHNDDLLNYVDSDDELIVFEDEDETILTEYARDYYDELVKNKLTSSYINTKFSEYLEKAKITIYDEILYLHLDFQGLPVSKSKKASKTVVATVNGVDILVDDLYLLLEEKIGATTAMDLAIGKILFNSEYVDKITTEMRKEYREYIENVIRQFSQDAYAGSGYPASMGRKNFLRLSLRSETIEEAIEKIYVRSELERLFYLDYESHYGEEVYEIFTTLANRAKDQYFTISSSHLLIYVDMDEDDSPDDPEEFFETLTETQILEYKEMVLELLHLIHDRASKYSSFADGLQKVVDDFNDSTKYRTDLCDAEEGAEYRPECTWAKYKQYGFFLKFESLGSTKNDNNYPTSESSLDENFFERLNYLYDEIKEEYYEVDKKFPTQILDDKPISYEGDEEHFGVLETAFGWHLILVTGGDVSKSAKFTYDDDSYIESDDEDSLKVYEEIIVKDRDGNEVTLNAYSEDEYLTVNQVRVFLYESNTDRGVVSLPSDVLTPLNAYLAPIKTLYASSSMQMHLLSRLFKASNFEFANPQHKAHYENVLAINQKQFLNYSTDNELYLEMYGDWFEIFK